MTKLIASKLKDFKSLSLITHNLTSTKLPYSFTLFLKLDLITVCWERTFTEKLHQSGHPSICTNSGNNY